MAYTVSLNFCCHGTWSAMMFFEQLQRCYSSWFRLPNFRESISMINSDGKKFWPRSGVVVAVWYRLFLVCAYVFLKSLLWNDLWKGPWILMRNSRSIEDLGWRQSPGNFVTELLPKNVGGRLGIGGILPQIIQEKSILHNSVGTGPRPGWLKKDAKLPSIDGYIICFCWNMCLLGWTFSC